MISIKQGVDVCGLHDKMWEAAYIVAKPYANLGLDLVITSGVEGIHGYGSLHYVGLAIDIRIRDLTDVHAMFKIIVALLPSGYDIILEENKKHIHIEWQPKNRTEM